MNKYIDTDSLRKEIGHRIDILEDMSIKCAKNDDAEMHAYYHGKAISLQEFLSFIDSLQQEFPTTDKSVEEFLATHPKVEVPEKYKTPDFVFKKQEQPSLPDLDEAAEKWCKENNKGIALCADKKSHYLTDGIDTFKAGAEWQKEQMLKEAVEGEIQMRYSGCLCAKTIRAINEDKFKFGDKVRIIIVKEEKK